MDIRKSAISTLALTSIVLGGFSSSLLAEGISYTYAEARYILDGEIDDFDDYDGFKIGGSFQITNEIFAIASYTTADFDDVDGDFTTLSIGGGYIYPINPNWDTNFSLSYVKYESEARGYEDYDENGYMIGGGVRGLIKPQIELRASLFHGKLEDSSTWITIGGDYYFTPQISAGAEFDLGGDDEEFSIGAKYHF
jgi:long-subunit fatty acid transport protein